MTWQLLHLFEDMHEDGLQPIEGHYRLAISACASLGLGGRAAALLLRMQEKGMAYNRAAADAIIACNRANMPDVGTPPAARAHTARVLSLADPVCPACRPSDDVSPPDDVSSP
jgi:hypothetical protein